MSGLSTLVPLDGSELADHILGALAPLGEAPDGTLQQCGQRSVVQAVDAPGTQDSFRNRLAGQKGDGPAAAPGDRLERIRHQFHLRRDPRLAPVQVVLLLGYFEVTSGYVSDI